jgi:ankyrin repeat protein
LDVPEEHRRAEQLLCPTWEQAVQEREQWLAEHPDYVEPLNDTWFFEVRRGNVTTLRELLHRGADVEWPDEYGDRAIHLAAMDNSTAVLRLLLSAGASINARNKNGNTALHIATECGQTAMLQQLISAGADIEVRNRAKATAVVTACVHGQVDALRVLAAAGYTFSKVRTTLNLDSVDVLGALTFENFSQRRHTHSCTQGHAGAAFRCGKQPRGGGACDDRAGRGC